jgi:hypothetical protein
MAAKLWAMTYLAHQNRPGDTDPVGPPLEKAMTMTAMNAASGYEWVTATVYERSRCQLRYRKIGDERDSLSDIPGDVFDWADDDIRSIGGKMIGVPEVFRWQIQVNWE